MNSDRGIGFNLPDQRQHAWQALATEWAARMIGKYLIEVRKRIEPVANAARVIEIILNRAAPARLALTPDHQGLAGAVLLFFVGVAPRLISPTLLLDKIDNARRRVRSAIALRFAMIAVVHREFWLDQCDGKNFAAPLLRCAPAPRAERTGRHCPTDPTMRNGFDDIPGNLGAHDNFS